MVLDALWVPQHLRCRSWVPISSGEQESALRNGWWALVGVIEKEKREYRKREERRQRDGGHRKKERESKTERAEK